MKKRKLKIAPKYQGAPPHLKITSTLRLSGAWLRNAGFLPGDMVEVEVGTGRLVVTRKA
jgi:hypothetical protein